MPIQNASVSASASASACARKPAYPVTDDFVKIGSLAYPITHSFVVGERLVDDPNAPAILECYNFIYFPKAVPLFSYYRSSGNFNCSMTYALSNYPIRTASPWGDTEGPYNIQPLQELNEHFEDCVDFDKVHFGIGYSHTSGSTSSGFFPPVKHVTTKSWGAPRVGTVSVPFPDLPHVTNKGVVWFANEGDTNNRFWRLQGGGDFVMWVYDWEWMLDGERHRFDLIETINTMRSIDWDFVNAGVSNGLFQPGQQGVRVISRKYWDAPWERYPHL